LDKWFTNYIYLQTGLGSELQAGRLRVRFPMGSLGLFIDLILPTANGPGVNSACN